MIYALFYQNKLQYRRACRNLPDFKKCFYKQKSKVFRRVGYEHTSQHFNELFNRRFKHTVDGWDIRVYRNYQSVPDVITRENTKNKRDKTPVYDYFYVFDTESTNVNNRYSVTYLYGIRQYLYSQNFNDDTLEKYAGEYHAFYSKTAIRDFYKFLKNINDRAEKDGKLVVIYAHNLNYDLFELMQNIFPLFDLSEEDYRKCINGSIYRGSAVKVLRFRFKNLLFVDSLALINKSLAKVSQSHKIKKLVENKTYREQYFFGSKLPPEELEYNKHDLDVTALGIYDSIISLNTEFKTFNDFFKSNVLTITGASKFKNKNIFPKKIDNQKNLNNHVFNASRNLPKKETETGTLEIDKDRILFYQSVFQGGFTHANPFTAYNINLGGDKFE